MLSDALAQHLRARGWDRVLLLRGQAPGDAEDSEAVRRSLAKFGLTLADERVFEPSNDPRRRDLNNVTLLTGGARYDVVWTVDSEGDFARYVPYATYAARPVVGSEGLVARAWHWTFERYGAPQLNQRFRRLSGRGMESEDWAAWAAVRAAIEGVQRVGRADPGAVAAFVRSAAMSLDLYKGVPGSFRDWDGQLRQPILLATHDAVIAVAPVAGFEHRSDTLDTLGTDRPESDCRP
jgi:ABC transporter substrate binding protein (PQQ-dependent alcohol dehydrogenase system)